MAHAAESMRLWYALENVLKTCTQPPSRACWARYWTPIRGLCRRRCR